MNIKINDKIYQVQDSETVLDVCRRENIPIPTLCAPRKDASHPRGKHSKLKKEAVCRLCLVEIGGKLVTSCATSVCEGMEIITESEKIQKARQINMELLWSDHAGKCVKCKRNRHCELQGLAEEYKIDNFHFVPRKEDLTNAEELDLLKDNRIRVVVDDENSVISRTTEYCVECRRCINICPTKQYGFNNRAGDVVVGTPYEKTLDCIFCGACVKHCPTAALTDKNDFPEIERKLDDLNILAVAILDPAVMESVGNEFPATSPPAPLLMKERGVNWTIGLLRSLGFEKVFGLGWGMEKYARGISDEMKNCHNMLIARHCPAFDRFIEKYYPEFSKNISKINNPDELMAENIKNEYARAEKINPENICVISISSCTAKKAKKSQNLDYILTVRELGRLARKRNIDAKGVKGSKFDSGFSFDEKYLSMIKSGGLENLVGSDKKSVALNNMKDIKKVLSDIRSKKVSYDFVEGMICPGGCAGGGGQSINIRE